MYEIHDQGQSLIPIHGCLGSGEMFSAIVPELSNRRQVITVDLQGVGRTADVNCPIG